jgi:cytoplasmic tRNA 2-thiolation protein 2
MSLEEKRNDNLVFLRPLRELTSKEIAFYNHFNGKTNMIFSTNTSILNLPNSTIYRLTEKFINGLQNDYPTTVATIFRFYYLLRLYYLVNF